MGFFIDSAYAQAGEAAPDPLISFLPLILIFVVFYFLLIRPQQKRQKEHRELVAGLSEGDEVVTAGGILGKITATSEQFITIEVSNGVSIKVQRHNVGAVMPKGTIKSA